MDLSVQWPIWLLILLLVVVVAMVAAAIVVFIKFVRTFKLVQSDLMPMGGKLAFWGTALYVLSPVDLLPDPILFDDIGVMMAAVAFITKLAGDRGIDASTLGKLGKDVLEIMGESNSDSMPRRSTSRQKDQIDVDHADSSRIMRDVDDIIDIPPTK